MDDFEAEAKALFETSVSDKKFNDIITTIYPKPEEGNKKGLTVWENRIDILNDLYFKSPTQENIKGNAWGVFNALTERMDYFKERSREGQGKWINASGFDAMANAKKNKLFRQVKQLAGVK